MSITKIAVAVAGLLASSSLAAHSDPAKPAPKMEASSKKPQPHSGGTDSNGCHLDHKTGVRHCHNPK